MREKKILKIQNLISEKEIKLINNTENIHKKIKKNINN